MVGTFKSTGCAICRKRKKKCGEELPGCITCTKAGWKCPGYSGRWKFVDERKPLEVLYRKKKYIFEDAENQQDLESSADGGSRLAAFMAKAKYNDFNACSGIYSLLSPPYQQICSTLCHILNEPHNKTTFPIKSHGSFYEMIPARLGHNDALDDAVSCLCSLYTEVSKGTSGVLNNSYRLYAQSLRSLRKSLNKPGTRLAAETICASIILQPCELVLNDGGGRWHQLCQGTKTLIEESGPQRFIAPFEGAMFESQRAWFILQDASAGRECFLSQQRWRELSKSARKTMSGAEHACLLLRSQLCDFLVEVPLLVREVSDVAKEISNSEVDEPNLDGRRKAVVFQITSLKEILEQWYCAKILPFWSARGARDVQEIKTIHNKEFQNQELLFAVVDYVSNSLIARLDVLLATLAPASVNGGHLAACSRQIAVSSSFDLVRFKFWVAAKPLEYGLRQLWQDADSGSNVTGST